jgi:hypothetical protein
LARCATIKPNGERCKIDAMPGSDHCWSHDESMAEERRKRAQKGGRSGGRGRPQAELHRLQKWFEELAQQVIKGEVDRSDAAVTGQLLNYARACIRDALTAKEKEELEVRIQELEDAEARRKQSEDKRMRGYRGA